MKFSQNTGCFYPEWGNYNSIPSDVINVTEEEFNMVLNRQIGEKINVVNGKLEIQPFLQTLEEKQAIVKQQIKEKEIQKNERKFIHSDGNTYKISRDLEKLAIRISSLPDSSPLPREGGIEDIDENLVVMNCGQFRALMIAIYAREDANKIARKQHIVAMKQLEDPFLYSFNGGWA